MSVALFFVRLSSSGGAERMICWLANYLSDKGLQVILLSLDTPQATSFYPLKDNVKWIKLCRKNTHLKRTLKIAGLLKKYHVETMICFVASGDRTIYGAAKLARAKIIIAERNSPTMYDIRFSKLQKYMCFTLMHFADAITVQNSGFSSGYPHSLRKRITSIPNPVNFISKKSLPSQPNANGRFELLYVGRLDEMQKGVMTLIKAFSQVSAIQPLWDLRIVGTGPDREIVKQKVIELNLQSRVVFVEETSQVERYLSKANLFVIPSLWEGFPNALAEAMSAGLPSVGFSLSSGVSELIGVKNGWLAEGQSDPSSLATTLHLAMKDGAKRDEFGINAADYVKQFSADNIGRQWNALIQKLCGK